MIDPVADPITPQRAQFDAYYTPIDCAVACVEALSLFVPPPMVVMEPAVGGGSWVVASRQVWPGAHIQAMDLDPTAPGLFMADVRNVGDYLTSSWVTAGPRSSLTLGNPPYKGDVTKWIDRAREHSSYVAFLLRGTILGSGRRYPWWQANKPICIWTLAERPQWGGKNAHASTDMLSPVLVLWGPRAVGVQPVPQHRWLSWKS